MSKIYIKGNSSLSFTDLSTIGVRPCKGFYEALITPPNTKPYITNKSRLSHGTMVIGNSNQMRWDEREITLAFFIEGKSTTEYLTRLQSFINLITDGEIELKVEKLNLIYKIVYTGCSQYGDYGVKCGKFAVKFKEYNPQNRTKIST